MIRSPIGWSIPAALTMQGRALGLRFEDPLAGDVWTLLTTVTTWVLLWMVLIRSARWTWWARFLAFLPQIVLQPLCVMLFSTPINRMLEGYASESSAPPIHLRLSDEKHLFVTQEANDGEPQVHVLSYEQLPLGLALKRHVETFEVQALPDRITLERLRPGEAELKIYSGPWSLFRPSEVFLVEFGQVDE